MNVSAIYQWFIRRWLAAVILAAISFWIGYWVSDRRLAKKVSESAQGQVKEFVMFCDRLGCLDRAKFDEALIEAKAAMEGN
jgi:membrane protein DedA with SNARE-associated domain